MMKLNTSTVESTVVTALHDGNGSVFGGTVLTREQLGNAAWRFVDFWHIPPGASIGEHRHELGRECYFVVAGRGTMSTNAERFEVVAGDFILNEPGDCHGLANTSDGDLVVLVTAVIEEATA
jgi:quercetin dioxygenase-like cupin family protein